MTLYKWILLGYDKQTERIAVELELPNMTVEEMRRIFALPDDEPVVGAAIAVSRNHFAELARYAREVDADKYDYQIEAVAD